MPPQLSTFDIVLQSPSDQNFSTYLDGSTRSPLMGTDSNFSGNSGTVSRYRPSTEREVLVLIKLTLNPDKLTVKFEGSAELNNPRPGRSLGSISYPYYKLEPRLPGHRPKSATELSRCLTAIASCAQQLIVDGYLTQDTAQVYSVGLEALKRDAKQVWQQHLDLQTPVVTFPMRLYGNPIHSWRWA